MITGVDQPRCGIGVFHFTLLVSLQFRGTPRTLDSPDAGTCPFPFGPRNSGQSAAALKQTSRDKTANQEKMREGLKSFICEGCLKESKWNERRKGISLLPHLLTAQLASPQRTSLVAGGFLNFLYEKNEPC